MRTLSEAVSPADWAAICGRAVEDAKAGDAKARAWLSSYLLGQPEAGKLTDLAAHEASGIDPVEAKAKELAIQKLLGSWIS